MSNFFNFVMMVGVNYTILIISQVEGSDVSGSQGGAANEDEEPRHNSGMLALISQSTKGLRSQLKKIQVQFTL